MHLTNKPNVAIVGATGVVGTTLLSLMKDRNFTYNDISLLASAKSAGKEVATPSGVAQVQDLEEFQFDKTDIAFFSAGSQISQKHARRATLAGALVIDNTNAFRMENNVPLVVPQVNSYEINTRPQSGIIANPNCSTIPLVRLLKPLNDDNQINSVIVSTYQAASGAGQSGIEELKNSARKVVDDDFEFDADAERFSDPLGFNLIPNIDIPLASGFTLEEQKMLQETRKILNIPDFKLSATCVRVPVINAHSEAVYVKFENNVDRERVVHLLSGHDETLVFDNGPGSVSYPTPRFLKDPNKIHVGRIRVDPCDPKALWLWLIADNVRIGAALNALQIAEQVVGVKEQYDA